MDQRKVLVSWKEIGAYLGRDPRTCQRWQRELGLPIHRMDGSPKARIYAYPDELDRWLEEKLRAPELPRGALNDLTTPRVIILELTPLKVLLLIIALTAAIFGGTILWYPPVPPKPRLAESVSGQPIVVVPPFANESGDAGLDNWCDGLAELFAASLSKDKSIQVVPNDKTYSALEKLRLVNARKYSSLDIEKIAAQVHATYFLRGSFIKTGASFVITACLERPGKDGSPATLRVEARDEDGIVPKVDELARLVEAELNLH